MLTSTMDIVLLLMIKLQKQHYAENYTYLILKGGTFLFCNHPWNVKFCLSHSIICFRHLSWSLAYKHRQVEPKKPGAASIAPPHTVNCFHSRSHSSRQKITRSLIRPRALHVTNSMNEICIIKIR